MWEYPQGSPARDTASFQREAVLVPKEIAASASLAANASFSNEIDVRFGSLCDISRPLMSEKGSKPDIEARRFNVTEVPLADVHVLLLLRDL